MDLFNLNEAELNDKYTKKELIKQIIKLKSENLNDFKINDTIVEMLKNVQQELRSLKDEVAELRNDNAELKKTIDEKCNETMKPVFNKLVDLEIKHYQLEQYTRRRNIEIANIPHIVTDDNLEEKVQQIFKEIGVTVKSEDIEACHRLNTRNKDGNKNVIVRFVNRKLVEKIISVRKESANINNNVVGFPENTEIFINENLCPYYRGIFGKCRKLKKNNKMKYLWTVIGEIRVRRDDTSTAIKVTHDDVLYDNFPDFNFNQ